MRNWLSARKRNFDSFGQFLHRFGSMFFGVWIGREIDHFHPPLAFWLSKLALLASATLFWLAYFRSKAASENRLELPTR
jgi:hypothetical protein